MHKGLIQFIFSAVVHLALLAGILFALAAPRPFITTTEVAVEVDVVTPKEAETPKAEEAPQSQPAAKQEALAASAAPPPPEAAAAQAAAQQAPTATPPAANNPETPPVPRGVSRFDQVAAQLRYETHLGATDFDARATHQAALTDDQIGAFKARLKSCWRLEAGVPPGSRTHVVLRVALREDGNLAAEPTLVEAGAAADGPAIMRAAINAITGCAPFGLPRERYEQWRVMDIRFSPLEMGG